MLITCGLKGYIEWLACFGLSTCTEQYYQSDMPVTEYFSWFSFHAVVSRNYQWRSCEGDHV